MGGFWSKKDDEGSTEQHKKHKGKSVAKSPFTCNPYVLKKVSSMFFDEDGDLAHEFYEECRTKSEQGSVRWTMRRLLHNGIRPQGEIYLTNPRLHVDLPVVLIENV